MIKRHLATLIKERLKNYPAVALLGARQSGKTTLARTFSGVYFDLELEQDNLRLDLQWDEVAGSKVPVILDEAQNFPEIFPRIRAAIDLDRKRNGRFLILGSVSPGLMKQVSEFLTGRIALVELGPLSLKELPKQPSDDLWLMGGFPDGGILKSKQYPPWFHLECEHDRKKHGTVISHRQQLSRFFGANLFNPKTGALCGEHQEAAY